MDKISNNYLVVKMKENNKRIKKQNSCIFMGIKGLSFRE